MALFEGFETGRFEGDDAAIAYRKAGDGPPVLLLHGFPQTHVLWHRVAPRLAERFTVVCADLRGYGDSAKPDGGPDHAGYSKRAMAADMAGLMTRLGFGRFAVVGHDRGGRVGHRLALDHRDRVERLALLDIVPTRTVFQATDRTIAEGYYHWFFLIQSDGLPERLIGADPGYYLRAKLAHWSGSKSLEPFHPEAVAAYERGIADPRSLHAMCEDYRAAAGIDLEHDEADIARGIACPLLVLWGEKGLMHRRFDVLAAWRERAAGPVGGGPLPCGHYLPEEAPEATVERLAPFLAGAAPA